MAIKQAFILTLKEEITNQQLHGMIDDAEGNSFCEGVEELETWDNDNVLDPEVKTFSPKLIQPDKEDMELPYSDDDTVTVMKWICPCGEKNYIDVKVCYGCKNPRGDSNE